jgi:GT2 family glycosyltransferase
MTSPHVQVLILNWNGYRDTIRCLESVFALAYPRVGVVVCDNGSTDGSVQRIREWAEGRGTEPVPHGTGAPTRREPLRCAVYDRATAEAGGPISDRAPELVIIETGANLGFAGGNNIGLRYLLARGDADYFWLLNNDTVVSPGALRALVDRAERQAEVGAVGGTLLELDEPDRVQEMGGATVSWWHGMVKPLGHGAPADAPRPEPKRLDYVTAGCMLVRRRTVAHVGLLDERFFLYGEDVDWGARMLAAGYRLAYAPDANVWHKGSGSAVRASATHDFHNTRASLLLIHKHRRQRLPIALGYATARCLLPKLVRGEWRRFATVARALRDVVREVRSGVHGPHEAPARRRIHGHLGLVSESVE